MIISARVVLLAIAVAILFFFFFQRERFLIALLLLELVSIDFVLRIPLLFYLVEMGLV